MPAPPPPLATLPEVLERSRSLGFLGPGDIDPHVRHAEAFVDLTAASGPVLDLGSGGGLPGLVLATRHPDMRLTLLDANERRIVFLRDAIRQLGMDGRVGVALGRAEELARRDDLREAFEVVVARSFGAPAVTAECAAGFLRLGGRLLVSEPEGTVDRWPTEGLSGLGLTAGELHRADHASIRVLHRTLAGLDDVPRRVGVPARRPRF